MTDRYAELRKLSRNPNILLPNIIVRADDVAALLAERDELAQDAARLNFLDRLNSALNSKYGTEYRWALILSPHVVRLMSGRGGNGLVADIDLHDSEPNGYSSCRAAIDAAMKEAE